jgi:HK97 family phage portal protein
VIVRSFTGVQALTTDDRRSWSPDPGGSVRTYDRSLAFGEVYARQPNIRIPTDFLARNLAHLSPHVFRRVSDTDRVRLNDHQLAQWLRKPSPFMTGYRLLETLGGDLGVYMEAFWLKVRYTDGDNQNQIGLMPLPPEEMGIVGRLIPQAFIWTVDGKAREFPPSEIVHFSGYNPINRLRGLSLIETLGTVVAEEDAASRHRETYWRSSARIEGVVTRPATKPRYNQAQIDQWREGVQKHSGSGGGRFILFQDGETFTPASWSAKDSEFIAGGKLRREVTTAGYHVPQPMVGILDHATFSNIKEQHKHLYQDTLGPTLEMVTQEIERQVLPECRDQRGIYVEFNIAAKLAGTPEEQTDSLRNACGRAFMSVNEARARVNLPRDDDPESDRIAPQQGGPSDATANPSNDAPPSDDPEAEARAMAPVITATRERQQDRLAKLPVTDRPAAFTANRDRWDRELAADLRRISGRDEWMRAATANAVTLAQLENDARDARIAALEQG